MRLGRLPSNTLFDTNDTTVLLRRYHSHKNYMDDSSNLLRAAKPNDSTTEINGVDWVEHY